MSLNTGNHIENRAGVGIGYGVERRKIAKPDTEALTPAEKEALRRRQIQSQIEKLKDELGRLEKERPN